MTCDANTLTCRRSLGQDCTDNAQCASPLRCRDGECTDFDCATVQGDECTVSGSRGECARGTVICNGNQRSCQARQPSAEVCDGRDNDCDGRTDEEEDVPTVGDECAAELSSCRERGDTSSPALC